MGIFVQPWHQITLNDGGVGGVGGVNQLDSRVLLRAELWHYSFTVILGTDAPLTYSECCFQADWLVFHDELFNGADEVFKRTSSQWESPATHTCPRVNV